MLKLNKKVLSQNYKDKSKCTLFPKNKDELIIMIEDAIRLHGNNCSLNHIDVSKVKNMFKLFSFSSTKYFDGDISEWDVSNVIDMSYMFEGSWFTGRNGSLENWDVSNVRWAYNMFHYSNCNSNLSHWFLNDECKINGMFNSSKIIYKPKNWDELSK